MKSEQSFAFAVLAGRRVEESPYPPYLLSVKEQCERCKAPFWLGPRQQAMRRDMPDATYLACIQCAATMNPKAVASLGNPNVGVN